MSRFIVVALLLHIPLFAYPVLRLSHWLELTWWLTLAIFIPVFFSQIFARKVLNEKTGKTAFVLRNMADFILGVAPVVLLFLLLAEVSILLLPIAPYHAACGVIVGSAVVVIYGVWRAFYPEVMKVDLASKKLDRSLRFVQISDVHIGSRSTLFLQMLVRKINEIEPEFLCITGDFIDQPGITESQLGALKDLKMPIYYVIGNHERYEDLDAILQRLEALGVVVLRNKSTAYQNIQIIGIDDKDDALQVEKQLQKIPVSEEYSILLYHRPVGLEACEKYGVDLMLSGHTHGGQIFPFNLIVNRVFERVTGLFRYGKSHLYVSQGTGTWGPVLRVGTKSEITLFSLGAKHQDAP